MSVLPGAAGVDTGDSGVREEEEGGERSEGNGAEERERSHGREEKRREEGKFYENRQIEEFKGVVTLSRCHRH